MRLFSILAIFLLASCATSISDNSKTSSLSQEIIIPRPVFLDDSYFGKAAGVISVEGVFKLSERQEKNFFKYFNKASYQTIKPNRRIQKYLENHLQNFNFFSDTYTANETIANDSGNCLSLAILTNALAKLAKVKIKYELVATPPVYQKEGGIVLGSQHIRTVLYDPLPGDFRDAISWWQGKIKIDYFSTWGTLALREVDVNEFHAMYYRNKAAEFLIAKNNKQAFWHLKKALQVNEQDAQAINMMALLHARLGFDGYAEALYQHGLQYGAEKLELLSNYRSLLIRKKRFSEVEEIAKQLAKYDDPDPYKWMNLGDSEFNKKNYSAAISYYRKANKMADYLHEPYVGMARAHYFLGNLSQAHRYMKRALENTYKKETKSLYRAKYQLLSRLLDKS